MAQTGMSFMRRAFAQGRGRAAATLGVGATAYCTSSSPHAELQAKEGMAYRMLGNTGLQVSVLSFGFWATYGSKDALKDQKGIDMAKDCMRVARKAGVNLFDNAEVYGTPRGSAETIMGEAIRQLREEDPSLWRRSELLITTKIFWAGDGVNEKGLSRKHVLEGTDAALKRLQVDYADLIFCHRPDPYTPTETVVRAMTDVVRSGKATSWGTSEWSAQQITEAFWIAKLNGLEPPAFEQPQYHMFHRERLESEYFPLFKQPYAYGTTIWSPLASGLLTGKYNDTIPEGSRATAQGYGFVADKVQAWRKDGTIDKVRALSQLATEQLGCTMGQLAIAWCVKNENVSTVLLGATTPAQLEETLGAVDVARRLTPKMMAEIEEILGNEPPAYAGYGNKAWFRTLSGL